ncbi:MULTISPECIES: exodeoxyribonuclease VII small subunit [Oleiagrimonas]|jgi:exodeoxyribonuclease VII small subunit|uniref:Exodeoxyribonuclease 7 small subunit n=1 Tax=Oleiagrimonas citrea TaxID=1665687 RepID=A0A846ZJR8_9GAMM|nr:MULTISPECIES: exodeoxyribonuclease VII small subunit [Oleiagrimonas]NKZ37947.1 exodeoxyribonuclease VII small subunit [Oleiagrimonas citrea]RAP57440.1 exodeoxyribonuclease VII small subunit [Oleiagrimonas sp. MCCC 1A03011]
MAKPPASETPPDQIERFEHSLNELEQLVGRMEDGELSLDESLQSFERGVALYRDCESALKQAQLRVSKLLDPEDPDSAEPLEPESP